MGVGGQGDPVRRGNGRNRRRVPTCDKKVGMEPSCHSAYAAIMPKKQKDFAWEVTRIKGNPAAFVGLVKASDEKAAIKAAIAEFKIINPEHQKRLVARRQSSATARHAERVRSPYTPGMAGSADSFRPPALLWSQRDGLVRGRTSEIAAAPYATWQRSADNVFLGKSGSERPKRSGR